MGQSDPVLCPECGGDFFHEKTLRRHILQYHTKTIAAAKSQAVIIRRIANRMRAVAEIEKHSAMIDFADHLATETNYLMDYLGMPKEER